MTLAEIKLRHLFWLMTLGILFLVGGASLSSFESIPRPIPWFTANDLSAHLPGFNPILSLQDSLERVDEWRRYNSQPLILRTKQTVLISLLSTGTLFAIPFVVVVSIISSKFLLHHKKQTLIGVLIFLFAYFIWPTPYAYYSAGDELIKRDRLTGHITVVRRSAINPWGDYRQ